MMLEIFQESSGCNMLIFWVWPTSLESTANVFCERRYDRWRRICYSEYKIHKDMETSEFWLSF